MNRLRAAAWLLLVQPAASALYLACMRWDWLAPRFTPAALMALFPAAALGLALHARATGGAWAVGVIAAAALELAWNVLLLAIVGFGIAWRTL